MSKVKKGGWDQYGAESFKQQQFATAGIEGLSIWKFWTAWCLIKHKSKNWVCQVFLTIGLINSYPLTIFGIGTLVLVGFGELVRTIDIVNIEK